jgi:homoserine kinase
VKLTARVPATVANLGPGFDAFGLALALYNQITVDTDAEPSVTIEGEGADELPRDGSNLVLRTMAGFAQDRGAELPPLSLTCTNRIPLERGLGSSASAVVAALLLADRLLEAGGHPDEILDRAAHGEGHADNVAAAVHGRLTIAYLDGSRWRAERLDPSPDLRPVILVPLEERMNTDQARAALTQDVHLVDAVFNASRAALLVLALTERPDLLPVALEDRLHQEARLQRAPMAASLFQELRERDVPVCVAGSGPALLAFEGDEASVPDPGPGWVVLRVDIAPAAEVRGA